MSLEESCIDRNGWALGPRPLALVVIGWGHPEKTVTSSILEAINS